MFCCIYSFNSDTREIYTIKNVKMSKKNFHFDPLPNSFLWYLRHCIITMSSGLPPNSHVFPVPPLKSFYVKSLIYQQKWGIATPKDAKILVFFGILQIVIRCGDWLGNWYRIVVFPQAVVAVLECAWLSRISLLSIWLSISVKI